MGKEYDLTLAEAMQEAVIYGVKIVGELSSEVGFEYKVGLGFVVSDSDTNILNFKGVPTGRFYKVKVREPVYPEPIIVTWYRPEIVWLKGSSRPSTVKSIKYYTSADLFNWSLSLDTKVLLWDRFDEFKNFEDVKVDEVEVDEVDSLEDDYS